MIVHRTNLRILVLGLILSWIGIETAQAQVASLARDLVGPRNPPSNTVFEGFEPLGESLLFTSRVPGEAVRPWISDGTPNGTFEVPAPCPGPCAESADLVALDSGEYLFIGASPAGSGQQALWVGDATRKAPLPLTPANVSVSPSGWLSSLGGTQVLTSAHDETHGQEPWVSDGTPGGTRLLVDLVPGPQDSSPRHLHALSNRTLFFGDVGGAQGTLFATDGSAGGTIALLDLGSRTLRSEVLTVADDRLFFFLEVSGRPELWVSDGTPAGTKQLHRWLDQGVFLLANAVAVEDELAFVVETAEHGPEVWVSNGSAAGTRRISELPLDQPFDYFESTLEIARAPGRYVFLARGYVTGSLELWASDGDPSSTTNLLADCASCAPWGAPGRLVRHGGQVFLAVAHPGFGSELWVTDGTALGTRLFHESCPGSCGEVTALASVGDDLYWVAPAALLPSEYKLWRYDGASSQVMATFPARFPAGPRSDTWIAPLAGGVVFPARDHINGSQLWWAAPGHRPRMLTTVDAGTGHSEPRRILDLDGRAVFHACANGFNTRSLWSSMGGSADTVRLTADGTFRDCGVPFETNALAKVGSLAFFVPGYAHQPPVLWRTDGTPAGTQALLALTPTSGLLGRIADHNGLAYFPQIHDDRFELWRSDGTTAGTFAVATVEEPLIRQGGTISSVAGRLYFEGFVGQKNELWTSDGSSAGTVWLTVQGEPGSYFPPQLTAAAGRVFFRAFRQATGYELWQTDGTPAGTGAVIDLWPGPEGSYPSRLTAFGARLFFFADSGPETWGLWSSDGTADGTGLVRSFTLGAALPAQPTTLGARLLFAADDGAHGHELWSTDGTEAGTTLVADIFAQAGSSLPDELTVAGDRVFFVAREPIHGRELWVTDGTPEGTKLVHDLMPGPASSAPEGLSVVGSRLYFSADDGVHGRELWSLDWTTDASDGCPPSEAGLCLQDNRFRVEIDWRDFEGSTGRGTPVPLTADTGSFWFFSPDNVETIVKVLDGRVLNDHFWTFYGALSNVEYTMTVTDTATGLTQRYFNPSGQFASVGDTSSFGPDGASFASFTAPSEALFERHPPHVVSSPSEGAKQLGCSPAPDRLCLNDGRFAVEATWTDFRGNSGAGQGVGLTADTGYFWFFRDANIELVIKVLDGRPVNGSFWVFYGALSNVEYTITVTDTETGAKRTYFNPSGRFASVGDTGAFPFP